MSPDYSPEWMDYSPTPLPGRKHTPMDEQNALTYKRSTLIDVLKERLAERQNEREEARKKELEKSQTTIDSLTKALENPQFVVAVVGALRSTYGSRFNPAQPEEFAARVAESWPVPDGQGQYRAPYDPDLEVKRLIRVFEKAEDDTVQVTVTDEVYAYL